MSRVRPADAVISVALVPVVVIRPVRILAVRILVISLADTARARLSDALALPVSVQRR